VVEPGLFDSRENWAEVLLRNLEYHKPDLVVLAGFMKVLPAGFVTALSPNIINLHPSLLPAFPGAHAVRDALSAGASSTGATVHIVDTGVDTGPILAQREIAIPAGISQSDLHEQIKTIERSLIVEVVSQIAEGKLNLSERSS
jgi:phosphoribosylglycinamide formyltransferase-1